MIKKLIEKLKLKYIHHGNYISNENKIETNESAQIQTIKACYDDYLKFMSDQNWICNTVELGKSLFVTKISVEKGRRGSFLDIRCSAGHKLAFVGLSNVNINPEHFSKYANLYRYPYSFSIICKDDNGNELNYDKSIEINKVKPSNEIHNITNELYGDLNIRINERYKKPEERFYFKQGFELNGEEHLVFSVNPNIDISKIEIIGKADLFTKE